MGVADKNQGTVLSVVDASTVPDPRRIFVPRLRCWKQQQQRVEIKIRRCWITPGRSIAGRPQAEITAQQARARRSPCVRLALGARSSSICIFPCCVFGPDWAVVHSAARIFPYDREKKKTKTPTRAWLLPHASSRFGKWDPPSFGRSTRRWIHFFSFFHFLRFLALKDFSSGLTDARNRKRSAHRRPQRVP